MLLLRIRQFVTALRVMYMPHVQESKILYVDNCMDNVYGILKFTNEKRHREKMNVYIKNRVLYYVVDGEFYTFNLSKDRMSVNLVRKRKENKIDFYTWKNDSAEEEQNNNAHTEEIRKMNYLQLQPGKNKQSNADPHYVSEGKFLRAEEKEGHKQKNHDQQSNPPQHFIDRYKQHEDKEQKNKNTVEKVKKGKHIEKVIEDAMESSFEKRKEPAHFKNPDAIESDTTEASSTTLELKIKMVNNIKKTFNLSCKDECLTFYNGNFLLIKCDQRNLNQIFQLKSKPDLDLCEEVENMKDEIIEDLKNKHEKEIRKIKKKKEKAQKKLEQYEKMKNNIKIVGAPKTPVVKVLTKDNTVVLERKNNKNEKVEESPVDKTLDRIAQLLNKSSF